MKKSILNWKFSNNWTILKVSKGAVFCILMRYQNVENGGDEPVSLISAEERTLSHSVCWFPKKFLGIRKPLGIEKQNKKYFHLLQYKMLPFFEFLVRFYWGFSLNIRFEYFELGNFLCCDDIFLESVMKAAAAVAVDHIQSMR